MNIVKKIISMMKIELLKIKYEKEYIHEEKPIKYMYFPSDSPYLIVTFSGFSRKGMGARYNYIKSFHSIDANKLFILDNYGPDGVEGSYYLGENEDFFIDRAVTALIKKTATEKGIENKNIITAGSSKGGYAAIYQAVKNNFGCCVVGAPQIFLADYLQEVKMEYIDYIMGDHAEETRERMNQLIVDDLAPTIQTKFYIHISTKDHHYKNHILPFIELLKRNNLFYELDKENYTNHGDVGEYYKNYAAEKIKEIIEQNT